MSWVERDSFDEKRYNFFELVKILTESFDPFEIFLELPGVRRCSQKIIYPAA